MLGFKWVNYGIVSLILIDVIIYSYRARPLAFENSNSVIYHIIFKQIVREKTLS